MLPLTALLRQNSSDWEAFFVVSDNADVPAFETELQSLLARYEDSRLMYLPLEAKFRAQVRKRLC